MLSGRGLCDELYTRPEECYRLWCVVGCCLENLVNEEALAHWGGGGCRAKNKQTFGLVQTPLLLSMSYFFIFVSERIFDVIICLRELKKTVLKLK